MSSKFSTSNNQFAAAYEQQSQPTSALITPLEERRKNRGSGLAYLGKSALAGLGGVLEGAGDLIVGSAALFSGDKAYAQHLFEDDIVGGWKHNNDAIYNPNSVMKFFGEAATGVGQSSVFLVPHVGTALFFIGVTGSGISEAVQTTGDLGVREYAYGALSGGTEAALEALTGAGGQVAKSLYGKTAAKAGTTALVKAGTKASEWAAKSAFLGVAKDMVSSAAGEFVEEFLGDYTDVLWKRVTGVDPEASTTLGEAMYSGLVGAVSGAFMSGTVSTINAARLQSMGRRTINEGNAEATISTARRVVDAFQTSDTSKLPPALAELRQSLAAYDSIADKTSGSAAFNLGRIKADIFYTQAYSGVQQVFDQLEQSSATSAQNIADYMSAQYNKKYTAEDFMKNKDGIRTVYAVEAWAYMYLSDSRAQQDMTAFKSIIDADKAGTAAGEPSAVRSVAEAVSDGVNAWNGSDAVYKAENATESGAQYIKIKKLGEDSYSIAWGSDAERMRGYTSRTAEEVRSILNVIAETDAQVTMGRQAAQEVSGTINSVESTINELQGVIDAGGVGETAEARYESLQNARDELARQKSTLADLKAAREQVNAGQDMQRAGLEGAQQLANMGGGLNTDAGVTYTAAEQDAARKAIDGFDTLHPDVRRSVLEWLRSSQGLDEKLRRSISNIIAARPGLNVLSAELGEGHRGLYSDSLGEGARLVVIDAKQAGDAATDVITHELAHDVEKSEGYAKLKKAAIASTSEARRREIIDMYVTQYEGVQSYTEWLGDRAGTDATWAEYLKAFPQIDGELVTQEIVAKAVGEKLGKTGFIEKYASRNVLTRALRSLRSLFRALKADKADGAALGATVKLGRAFERAMQSTRSGISSGGVRFSIQDGKVVIDTDQDIFDGVAVKDYAKTVREYMREHFRGTEIDGIAFDRTSEKEYTYSKYSRQKYTAQQDGVYDAKMRSSTELANIIQTSKYIGHETAVHPHDYNANGYDRYSVSFDLNGVEFSGEMLVAVDANDRHMFYDIVNIKKRTGVVPPQEGAAKGSSLNVRNLTGSGSSISQDGQNVNNNNKNNSKKFDIAEEENVNEYRKPITAADTEALREIGRKSVNDFTAEDIKKTRKWAYKFYRELGTKSPFFRAWFGDWRANDTSAVSKVKIDTIDFDPNTVRSERGTFRNNDTQWDIVSGSRGESETKNYARGYRASVRMLTSMQAILENAVLLGTEVSERDSSKKHVDTLFMHKLYTPVDFNGEKYIAKINVEEYYDQSRDKRRVYHLEGIKIEPMTKGFAEKTASPKQANIGSIDSVSDLYAFVKSYDKNFSTSGRASAVSNADGAPRVMYHGTNGGAFTVFDATKSNKRVRLNALGDGYYFTETAEKASRYGERVVDAYLDMKDPYRLYAREGGIRAQMAEDFKLDADSINRHDIQTILKQHGYDGVLLYHSKYDADSDFSTAVVFAPEQIKSALDNVGTFDRANPDIRYDLAEGTQKYDMSEKNAEYARKFSQRLDAWDQKTIGFSFVMGETPAYLAALETGGKKVGTKQVRMDASKLVNVMGKHSEMTIDVIKQLPYLLNDPMLVLDSKTVPGRLVLLGEVYADGKPVMMALELNATMRTGKTSFIDVVKVASAYTRANTQSLISTSNVRYVNKKKSRVDAWLKVNRLQLPLLSTNSYSADNSISQDGQNVNNNNKNNSKFDIAEDTAAKKASKKEAAEAKKKKAAEREAEEREIVREANRIVRKANRESVQAEREEFSERERRQAYSDKYARSVAKGVSDVYEVLSRNTAGRISDKIHEFFNLYDMNTAVEKTQEAIRDSYIRYRINYEKKLAANEAAIEQATKAGTEIPARLPALPDMAEFDGKVEQAGEYLREAYRRGDISGNIRYSEEKLRRALRKMVAGVKLTDGNGKEIASSATLKRNDQYRVAKRLAEVLTDSQLDADGRRKLFEAVAEYLTDNMVLGKTGLASTIAETMSSKDRLALQILQQSRGRIRDDKVLSDFVKAARRSGDQAAALTSAWLAKPGKKYFGVTPAEVAEMLKIKGIEIDTGSGSSVDIMNSLNSLYNRLYNEYHDIKRQVLEQHGMDVSALATKLETLYTEGGNYTYISKYEQALREYQADAMRKLDEANKKLEDAQAQSREQDQINRLTGQMRSKIERIRKRSEGFRRVGTQTGQDLDMVMKSATRVMRGSTVNAGAAIQFANDVLSLLRRSTPEMVALMEAIHAGNDPDGAMLKRYSEAVNRLGGESELARIFDDVVDPLLDIAKLGDYKVGEERTTVTAARPLTLDELKTIDTALQRVIDADTRHGRVYVNGEWVDSSSYATELAGTTDKRWRGEKSRVDKITLSRAVLETIRPALVFQILEGKSGSDTGVLSRFFGEIEKAAIVKQAEQLDMLKDILDFVNDGVEINGKKMGGAKYMQHYSRDTVKLTMNIPGKGTAEVLISIGEAMSFSATFRRKQARGNFALNAFEFEDNKSQNKAFVGRVAEKIAIDTDEDVDVIMDRLMNQIGRTVAEVEKQLTAEDMALMKLGETFFEKSKQLKMATDMTLYGKTNVISGYYFPLIRSSLSRDANYIDAGAVEFSPSTRNFSWNKRTIKNASGRLVIRDYLRVIEGHADQLATYAYMTIPVQNMQRVLNTRLEVSVNDCGTAREVITREVYSSFDKYVSKLFSDIQGRKRVGNELDAKLESFLGRSFTNVLGLNVQSMLKQFASACLAFGYVSPTSWSRGLMPRNREEMTKYSKAAFIRTNDAALASSHTGLNVSYLAGKTMGTLKLGDMAVTQLMWSMCQCQVEESLGLGIGTVENMTRAGEMLDYLISKCQDTSDATSKSALARTDNRLWQMTTLFRSQVGKTYSELVASAWALYDIHHRRAAGETVTDTELKQAQKHAAKLMTGFVMSSVFTATVAALISKLRGNSDDDTAADVIKSMALDTVGDMIGTIPLAGQLMQTLMSGYDAENFYYGVINDGLETVEAVWGLGAKVVTGQTVSSQEAARTIRKSLYLAGQMTGVPVRNVENIVKTVTHTVTPTTFYKYKTLFYSPATADVQKAVASGNERLAETAMRQLMRYSKTGQRSSARVSSELTRLYSAGLTSVVPKSTPTKATIDGEEIALTARQTREFKKVYQQADAEAAELVSSADYAALDDAQKAKALKGIYDIYYSRAGYSVLGRELATASALSCVCDDVPELVTAAAYMSSLKTDDEGKRKDKVYAYIAEYPQDVQSLLWAAAGYKNETANEDIIKKAAQLDESTRGAVLSALKLAEDS